MTRPPPIPPPAGRAAPAPAAPTPRRSPQATVIAGPSAISAAETPRIHELMLAMNEALVLGSLRQHELTAAADSSNLQLKAEIVVRRQAENALHRAQAQLLDRAGQLEGIVAKRTTQLTASNRRLEASCASIKQSREEYRLLLHQSQITRAQLTHVTHRILTAQEEERKAISRELHDDVMQMLVAINFELSALAVSLPGDSNRLFEKIAGSRRVIEESIKAVHRFARGLRPTVLDDLGLIPALKDYIKTLTGRKQFTIRLSTCKQVEALGSAERTALFRVAQEALTNVDRHAHATTVCVVISKLPGSIRLEISDNGESFSVEKVLFARNPKRLGLVGMRERIEMVGGQLTIESTPELGTRLRVDVPYTPQKRDRL